MVMSFDRADIDTGNTLQCTNASIDLNRYYSINNWLLAVFSMLSVRTNPCIRQCFFILNFHASCHSRYMGKCQMPALMWTTKLIVSSLGLWLGAHLRWRGTRFFSRMTSYKVVWHWKVEFVLDARWRMPKLLYLVCRYLPFAMIVIDLSRMSRNRYLKWMQSYSFSGILQHGLSIKVHHFPRMLWVKLNTNISVLHNLLYPELMWTDIPCKMSINWPPYQISEESCCTVQRVGTTLYMWPTRWNTSPVLFMLRVWAMSSHQRWRWIVTLCNSVVSRSFKGKLCLISQCVALRGPAWSYIDVLQLFLHKCVPPLLAEMAVQ
jgi:hypothetical protein